MFSNYSYYNINEDINQAQVNEVDEKYISKKKESIDLSKSYGRINKKEYLILLDKYSDKMELIEQEQIEYNKVYSKYKEDVLSMYNTEMLEGGYGSLYDHNSQFKESLFSWHTRTRKKPLAPSKGPNLSSYEKDYKRLKSYKSKTYRVAECSNLLIFEQNNLTNQKNLLFGNFCKVRLCPMCSWRNSLKVYRSVSQVMDKVEESYDYEYLFLTLTIKNCKGKDLNKTCDHLYNSFNKLSERKPFKDAVKGYFRAFEITYNLKRNDYHPHFHVVLAVNKDYFKKQRKDSVYLKHKDWVELWKSCLGIDYDPIVNIKKFYDKNKEDLKNKMNDSKNSNDLTSKVITGLIRSDETDKPNFAPIVAEVAKYTVKSKDYLIRNKEGDIIKNKTDEVVKTLDSALHGRRLISYGFVFKDIKKLVDQEEPEDPTNIKIREDLGYTLLVYNWGLGSNNYEFNEKDSKAITDEALSEEGFDITKLVPYKSEKQYDPELEKLFEDMFNK